MKDVRVNLNDMCIIHLSEVGWTKLLLIIENEYHMSTKTALEYIDRHTLNDGFRVPLWKWISVYHSLFYNGSRAYNGTNITIETEQ